MFTVCPTPRRYDFAAVILNAVCLLYTSPEEATSGLLFRFGGSFFLWLLTWSDRALRGIPYNPVQSILHVVGISAHMHAHAARARTCLVAAGGLFA